MLKLTENQKDIRRKQFTMYIRDQMRREYGVDLNDFSEATHETMKREEAMPLQTSLAKMRKTHFQDFMKRQGMELRLPSPPKHEKPPPLIEG